MSFINNEAALGIDIGGSKLMVGFVDNKGRVLCKKKQTLKPDIDKDDLLKKIIDNTESLYDENKDINIKCAGVAVPGLADPHKGTLVYACFSGIKNFKIGEILKNKFNIPVFVDNDVNVCAIGEKKYGICKDASDFLWVTVSNGIGGALVLNNKLYRGAFLNSGEIGHVNVKENGKLCKCGNKGCLEAHAAGPAIAKRYKELQGLDEEINAKEIAKRAKNGDEIARKVYRETGWYLGKAIASAVNLINPQKVILGGGVSMDFDLFISSLKDKMEGLVYRAANKKLVIQQTGLLYDTALIGAAAIAWKGIQGTDGSYIGA